MTRPLHLVGFVKPAGEYPAGWRHHGSPVAAGTDFGFVAEQVRRLEDAGFDAVFIPDLVGLPDVAPDVLERVAVVNDTFEPLTLLAALSVVTDRIGLIGTVSTSYATADAIAAELASLQALSGGRAGWNVVTSLNDAEARNFGRTRVPHDQRYAHAGAVVDAAAAAWQARGIPRPVIAQAGSSPAGRDLAARVADLVFVRAMPAAQTREFADDIRARAIAHGRPAGAVRILPELATVVATTTAEAEAHLAEVRALLDPRVALGDVAYWTGADLTGIPLDAPLPPLRDTEGSRGAQREIYAQAQRDGLTIGDLARLVADGDGAIVGSPADVADHIERFADEAGVDGFTVSFPWLPGTLDGVTRLLAPELRRRGLLHSGSV
jgi:N-acetyl-S-(2-succino)cysteine monooxygenase